ncbi:MAG TPA: hypothetical protein VJ779_02935 [Acetobacteraceae bacterium]|nr:hypothetical protein [Acetobacteraceae bacterium]
MGGIAPARYRIKQKRGKRRTRAADFVSDAYAHAKFIAYAQTARPLMQKAGATDMDEGFVALETAADAGRLVEICRKLRFWEREAKAHSM